MALQVLAGSTGLEPAASGVTGRRYNQLNYDPSYIKLYVKKKQEMHGGRNRDRTCDIQLVRLALSQLSYSP